MTTIASRFVTACLLVGLCAVTVLLAEGLLAPPGAQTQVAGGTERLAGPVDGDLLAAGGRGPTD